ncbi:MAG TPA: hypothetical protein VMV94_20500 [Phycisphaerae bacterium]|nr:hypothetical protein [Phycisphaerae bacterium]
MRKMLLLVVLSAALLGTSCPGGSALTCSNNLDGSQFGFTMTVPADFTCASGLLNSLLTQPPILGLAVYNSSANQTLTVIVVQPGGSGNSTSSNITWEDLPDYTTANGLVFGLRKGTRADTGAVEYVAAMELTAGGNILGVSLNATADDASLLTTLQGILDTVQLVAT